MEGIGEERRTERCMFPYIHSQFGHSFIFFCFLPALVGVATFNSER